MMSSKRTDKGGTATADLPRALRDPEAPVRYRLRDRFVDAWNGRRDGRIDASSVGDSQDVPLCASVWLAHNRHLFYERDRREFLDAQAVATNTIIELRAAAAAADRAQAMASAARSQSTQLPAGPSGDELARRGPGEQCDSEATIAARRFTAHRRAQARAEDAARSAEQAAQDAAARVEDLRADLESLFQITRIRSDRLREHHQRRATTFLRAHRRTVLRRLGAGRGDDCQESETIPAPEWTTQPCPWTVTPDDRPQPHNPAGCAGLDG